MEPERRVTRGMSRSDDRMEENERRALEELRRAMGQDLGMEDSVGGSVQGDESFPPIPSNPPTPAGDAPPPIGSPVGSDQTPRPENAGSGTNFGEGGTQGVMLALMQMVANMNKDMMEERTTFGAGWCPSGHDVHGGKECAAEHRRSSPKMA
ncbi:hypothetical protein TREMEDRAFT_59542 [Tremella mesenterica DSM 1558]|uniref:uncharacterized protein n=1 Tax=Tremella mesenterica (strain ATCC 24925 / CBS 8224 / DSM 1558 / NBRC 9311 / NRRL Y-6157 / RJB 2259-6 / UBC 559-6) TaxID=578456 RepID=UPI0003F4A3D2|nr:uncharacterized protein TREMEDRAFT_59542 [Tremella mesenterica DSM 1558]EIW73377.1 hypothetical protein TREMEDRAFT_59542 [Tremella mesenterica DSM 1558]